jgi:hypothetical protein
VVETCAPRALRTPAARAPPPYWTWTAEEAERPARSKARAVIVCVPLRIRRIVTFAP